MVDLDTYNQIVEKHYKKILKYCLARLSFVIHDAEEAADDVFVTLWMKWDALDLSDNVSAWLYRVADNCIKRLLSKRTNDISLDEFTENIGMFGAGEDEIESLINDISYEQKLDEIKRNLPDNLKDIFIYRFID